MAFIFVPLTTVTMGPVPNSEMGNATSLFNLMRNLGAGAGISSVTTMVARRSQFHQARLASQLTTASPALQQMLAAAKAMLMHRGYSAADATRRALALVYALVQQQSALLSFVETFFLLAIIFLCMAPLVMMMRRPTHHKSVSAH